METFSKTTTHFLTGSVSWEECHDSILAHTFDKMVALCQPVIQQFRGDLFRDALWMNENITGECVFFWCFNESGTQITKELDDLGRAVILHRENRYRLDLRLDSAYTRRKGGSWDGEEETVGMWYLDVTELSEADLASA